MTDETVERDLLRAELVSATQELERLRSDDRRARMAMRLFLLALGLNPDDPNLRPLMEAKRIRADLDRMRALHPEGEPSK